MSESDRTPPAFELAATQATLLYSPEPPRSRPEWDRYRASGNRSFPTGYPVPSEVMMGHDDFAEIKEWEQSVRRELGMDGGIFRGMRRRARIATIADRRVMVGPSDEDVAAVGGEILHGWCLAKGECYKLGVARDDPLVPNPPARYGLVLDYLTRDIAKQLHVLRRCADEDVARERYGLDVVRISIEHGVTPDALAPYLSRLGATFD
jgi:hypothetical protein